MDQRDFYSLEVRLRVTLHFKIYNFCLEVFKVFAKAQSCLDTAAFPLGGKNARQCKAEDHIDATVKDERTLRQEVT